MRIMQSPSRCELIIVSCMEVTRYSRDFEVVIWRSIEWMADGVESPDTTDQRPDDPIETLHTSRRQLCRCKNKAVHLLVRTCRLGQRENTCYSAHRPLHRLDLLSHVRVYEQLQPCENRRLSSLAGNPANGHAHPD